MSNIFMGTEKKQPAWGKIMQVVLLTIQIQKQLFHSTHVFDLIIKSIFHFFGQFLLSVIFGNLT